MKAVYNTNRRKTYRYPLNIKGKLSITNESDEITIENEIEIMNISIEGIKIFFKDNDLMNAYIDSKSDRKSRIMIEFEYDDEVYSFHFNIRWIKITDNAERFLLVYSGLCFNENFDGRKDKLLDILVSLHMENIFIGNVS